MHFVLTCIVKTFVLDRLFTLHIGTTDSFSWFSFCTVWAICLSSVSQHEESMTLLSFGVGG